ncbi:uncharacterized protein EI90DRAFT_3028412 [Cantharellus anzutake]|uniref:uncharacterized protein n=1 Tax=Cantharellus anzutake TaxID=1750568 RepID=UPI001908FCDB|nr:uncharacterized protein EI90DRAFT_3028412 [Cantharellus anzutake]KAF8344141.1 hypothetical protein EI90DRAFT_3028412 [Cantharellus anzutake]
MFSYNQSSTPSGRQWIALSTQSVGIGQGGTVSMIARVSLVDYRGRAIIDTYIRPTAPVASYRTPQTGIEPHHLENGIPFNQARDFVASAIGGKILVGHSLWQDLHVLGLTHPAIDTRDLGLFLPFRVTLRNLNNIIGLQTLMHQLMRRQITVSVQDSVGYPLCQEP